MTTDDRNVTLGCKLLPFGRSSIRPGCSGKFTATSLLKESFSPTRLIVPDDVARHFLITSFRLGGSTQFLSNAAIPAELFAEHGPRFNLLMDDLLPDPEKMELDVQSTSDSPQTFSGFLGSNNAITKKVILGYGSTPVEGHSCANISVEPFRTFRPTHLFLPSTVSNHFLINEVRLSQYGTNPDGSLARVEIVDPKVQGRAEASDLTEISSYALLGGRLVAFTLRPTDIVSPRRFLTMSVTNRDSVQRSFVAAVIGNAVNFQSVSTG